MGIYFVGVDRPERDEDDSVTIQADPDEVNETTNEPPATIQGLETALCKTQAAAYAKGTIRNLLCQWRSFLRFYKKYKLKE